MLAGQSTQGPAGKQKFPSDTNGNSLWVWVSRGPNHVPAGISQTCLLSHCSRGGGSLAIQESILKINRSLNRAKRRMLFKRNMSRLSKCDRAGIPNANATFRRYKPTPCSQLSVSACGQPARSRQLRLGSVLNPVCLGACEKSCLMKMTVGRCDPSWGLRGSWARPAGEDSGRPQWILKDSASLSPCIFKQFSSGGAFPPFIFA